MPFTAPKVSPTGRIIPLSESEAQTLGIGQRCLVCFESDPAAFAACTKGDCYAVGPFRQESEPGNFAPPKPLVSAYDLAARMRAKALTLDWEHEAEAGRLLQRARELETGDSAEVPEEYF